MCQYLLMPWTGSGTQYGSTARGPLKTSSYISPSSTIFCQDAAEQKPEGPDDTLGLFPGKTSILDQWAQFGSLSALYGNADLTMGWWRHGRACVTLWVPGHVSSIKYTPRKGGGADYRWYTGERPNVLPK